MSERILTAAQVAELFQIDRETVYRMAQQGRIPAFKVGYQWRFSEPDLREWCVFRTGRPGQDMPQEEQLKLQEP